MKQHVHVVLLTISWILLNNPVAVQSAISISSTGPSRSGEGYTLTCTSSSPLIEWKKGGVTVVTGTLANVTVTDVSTSGGTSERLLIFNPLRVAHGGIYTCEDGSDSTTETVTVNVPAFISFIFQPSTTQPIHYAATSLKMFCTYVLGSSLDDPGISARMTFFRNGIEIAGDSRISLDIPPISKTLFSGSLIFDYLTISDKADYKCEGFLFSTEEYVTNSSQTSNNVMLSVAVPSIDITLTAQSYLILVHEDYNTLSLTCSDTLPTDLDELEFNKQYTWLLNGTNYTSNAVGPSDLDKRESNGSLSLPINDTGVVTVTCRVSIQVPGDPVISSNESITVTIQGPVLPNSPTNLRSSSLTNELSSFIVYWTVSSIAYTPEQYTVRYGTSQSSLTNTSATINGSTNLSATDIEYSIKLTNLNSNTLYYFTVTANNTEGGVNSVDTGNFTTLRIKVPDEAPRDFTISLTNSDAITLRWRPVREEARNDPITSYTVSCNSTESISIIKPIPAIEANAEGSPDYSATVTNLNAYTVYLCALYANNSGGAGPVTTATIRTPEDKPSAPVNVSLTGRSPSSIAIRWSRPLMPNGVIIHYTVYMNLLNGSTAFREVDGDEMEYVVTDLMPYQVIDVSVSASTSSGEGSRSPVSKGQSLEAAPKSIPGVRYIVVSESRLKVNFTKPSNETARGKILYYSIIVMEYGVDVVLQNATIPGNSTVLEAFIDGLEGEIPYRVLVFAVNSAGTGDTIPKILFTKEGIPPPPSSIITQRLNGTHIRVTWDPIPLTLAKGFITHYYISYNRITTPTNSNTKRQSGAVRVFSNQTSVIIGELTPSARYSITVSAINSAGTGIESSDLEVDEFQTEDDEGVFSIVNIVIVVCCVLGLIILVFFVILVGLVIRRRNGASKRSVEELPQNRNVVVPAHIQTSTSMAYGQLPGTPEPMLDHNHPLGNTHIVAPNPTYNCTPEPFQQSPTYNYAYAKPPSGERSYEKPIGKHSYEKPIGAEHLYESIDNIKIGKEGFVSYDVPKPQLPAARPSMSNGSNHITMATDQQ